jgi:amino acid adenylation domain-containing protein
MENGGIALDKLAVAADQKSSEEKYWITQFSGELIKNSFPYDFYHTDGAETKPKSLSFQLPDDLLARLMELSKKSDLRLFIILLSALLVLVQKYTGNHVITLGTPIYKQETEDQFINKILALRHRLDHHLTFKELLLETGKVLFQAVENQNYPVETLLHQLNIPYSREKDFPLFDIVILLENIHDKKYIQHIRTSIVFYFLRTHQDIKGIVEYDPLRYEKTTAAKVISHFMNLLRQVLHHIDIPIGEIEILSREERQQLLFDYNHTGEAYTPASSIHRLFENQVEKKPDHMALSGSRQMTYAELNRKSNQLALFLISKGVKPESIVAIMAEGSPEMIIGLLGILKAGGAYLPFSPDLPMARKKIMLKDSKAAQLLLQKHLSDANRELIKSLSPGSISILEDLEIESSKNKQGRKNTLQNQNPQVEVRPENPGYIIYTSGSTGQPKGVILQHKGIVNYVMWAAQMYIRDETMTFPLYTSFSFDLTVTSIFTPLITGNMIVIYSGDHKEFLINKIIAENRVNVVKLTPSHLKLIREIMMESSESFPGENHCHIKRLIVGGENLETSLANDIDEAFNHDLEIYNEYGPTETVVGSMIHKFNPGKDNGESVPIGVPITNTQIYLLDENKKTVPVGVIGELFISGKGVARGYLNRPELTAEKFINNPFLASEKMYASGDLARRCANGHIEFLGRKDQQVKIRGYRVELAEIETQIKNFNGNNPSSIPGETTGETPKPGEEKRCCKCLLTTNYPGIHLDDDRVCHVCREFEKYHHHIYRYFKEPEDFIELVEKTRKANSKQVKYDCLLLFSGGKDSTYVLYRLIEMGLRVFTFTFDNGYISETAFKNIKKITSALNVDNMVVRAENMNDVFVESLTANHNVCQGCWHALNTFAIKIAHEKGISLVISGLSRGQIFEMRLEGLFRVGIFAEKEIEEKLLLFRKNFHSKDNRFSRILNAQLHEEAVERMQFVDFFRYFDTPVQQIMDYLSTKGWIKPGDTGFCSSNCMINDVGIYIYLKERGYHFYAAPLSWDIRLGQLSREEGLEEMSIHYNPAEVNRILEEIGYYDAISIQDAVVIAKADEKGNSSLWAYILTRSGKPVSLTTLRKYLSARLPDYMIPAHVVQVDNMPLTMSGKVDKKALLESEGTRLKTDTVYVAPRDEKENLVAAMCQEIFNIERPGINDNFFDLGATSFSIIQLNSKLQEVLKTEIPVLTMFEYPSIASLLGYIYHRDQEAEGGTVGMEIGAANYQEEADWVTAKKKGQDKFRKLRNKRIKGDSNG